MAHATGPVLHDDAVDWLQLIRSEYLEMPGLHLTIQQARQMWRLDASTGRAVLDALVEAQFLRCTDRGAYLRADAQ